MDLRGSKPRAYPSVQISVRRNFKLFALWSGSKLPRAHGALMEMNTLDPLFHFTFGASLFLVLYTYLLYPGIMYLLASLKIRRPGIPKDLPDFPFVSIIIAAYNEEQVIREKIENCFSLDYPADRFEVLIGSDGSTDRTAEIVRAYASTRAVRLFTYLRRGKVHTVNDLVQESRGEILVFTDANSIFEISALKELVRHLHFPQTGCVSGLLRLRPHGADLGSRGESFYWRYETFKKKMENAFSAVAGANGAIYALKRNLFIPLSPKTINDDFTISMKVYLQGHRIILAENANAYEYTAPDIAGEFHRHVRDATGHFRALGELSSLLNPALGMPFFCYVSHRVIRWLVPFFLFAAYVSSFLLSRSPFFMIAFILQTTIYLVSALLFPYVLRGGNLGFLFAPYYFLIVNFAIVLGFVKFCFGNQTSLWNPRR